MIGGFRSDLSITCMIDGNFGNVSTSVLLSKVAYINGGKTLEMMLSRVLKQYIPVRVDHRKLP